MNIQPFLDTFSKFFTKIKDNPIYNILVAAFIGGSFRVLAKVLTAVADVLSRKADEQKEPELKPGEASDIELMIAEMIKQTGIQGAQKLIDMVEAKKAEILNEPQK